MNTTLFERLGGRIGISKIVDDTVENHMNNTNINARFLPLKNEHEKLAIIKTHTIDFFSMGSGGPANYHGRDMETAHKGMNISPGEYVHTVDETSLLHWIKMGLTKQQKRKCFIFFGH